jgi:hypothetical protein
MFSDLLLWLQERPFAYWTVALGATALYGVALARAIGRDHRGEPAAAGAWGCAGWLALLLLAWRWPPLCGGREMNPDESQAIAGALTLALDPVFFRSVDGTTAGPLNFYALLALPALGLPPGFFSARLTGLLLVWGTLLALRSLLGRWLGGDRARVAVAPAAVFFALATEYDFLHYTSEHVALFLGTAAFAALAAAARPEGPNSAAPCFRWAWGLAPFLAGLLPWAKLQAAPFAPALALLALAVAWRSPDRTWPRLAARLGLFAIAALLPTALALAGLVAVGELEEFWRSYVVQNIAYVDPALQGHRPVQALGRLALATGHFPAVAAATMVFVLAGALAALRRAQMPGALFGWGALLVAVACFAIAAPRRAFAHYLLFAVVPLSVWAAAGLNEGLAALRTQPARTAVLAVFVLVVVGVPLGNRLRHGPPPVYEHLHWHVYDATTPPARFLRERARSGERLATWGWRAQLHVETGLPQGTREAHSFWQIQPSPQRDHFRARYLRDLGTLRPEFFADAVGPEAFHWNNRDQHAHETWPDLAVWVRTHYVLLHDWSSLRLYVARDRLAADRAAALDGANATVQPLVALHPALLAAGAFSTLPTHAIGPATGPTNLATLADDGRLRLRGRGEFLFAVAPEDRELHGRIRTTNAEPPLVYTAFWVDGSAGARVLQQGKLPPGDETAIAVPLAPGNGGMVAVRVETSAYPATDTDPAAAADTAPPVTEWHGFNVVSDRPSPTMHHRPLTELARLAGLALVPSAVQALTPVDASSWRGRPVLAHHLPSEMRVPFDGQGGRLHGAGGLADAAWSAAPGTSGTVLRVYWIYGYEWRLLHRRELDPVRREADRGLQAFAIDLAGLPAGELVFRADVREGRDAAWGWALWADLRIERSAP